MKTVIFETLRNILILQKSFLQLIIFDVIAFVESNAILENLFKTIKNT